MRREKSEKRAGSEPATDRKIEACWRCSIKLPLYFFLPGAQLFINPVEALDNISSINPSKSSSGSSSFHSPICFTSLTHTGPRKKKQVCKEKINK